MLLRLYALWSRFMTCGLTEPDSFFDLFKSLIILLSSTFAPSKSMTWLALVILSVFAQNIFQMTVYQSSGKQSKSSDITRSQSQSDDGSQ